MQNNKLIIILVALAFVLVSCTNNSSNSSSLYVNSINNYSFFVPFNFVKVDLLPNDIGFKDTDNDLVLAAFSGVDDQNTFVDIYNKIKNELVTKLNAEILSESVTTVNHYGARKLEITYKVNQIDHKYRLVFISLPNSRFLGISFGGPAQAYNSNLNLFDFVVSTLNFNIIIGS